MYLQFRVIILDVKKVKIDQKHVMVRSICFKDHRRLRHLLKWFKFNNKIKVFQEE